MEDVVERMYQHLRLPSIHAGGSARLPLKCFRLRGTNASQVRAVPGGPSTGRACKLQWHRCCDHSGQPCGWKEVLVRGLAHQKAPPSCASRLRVARCPLVRSCLYPWERRTTERPNTIAVARCYGCIRAQAGGIGKRRAIHPLAQAEGLSGSFSVMSWYNSTVGVCGDAPDMVAAPARQVSITVPQSSTYNVSKPLANGRA